MTIVREESGPYYPSVLVVQNKSYTSFLQLTDRHLCILWDGSGDLDNSSSPVKNILRYVPHILRWGYQLLDTLIQVIILFIIRVY